MIRIAVTGAAGRMGSRVIELARTDPDFEIVAALTVSSDPRLGQPAVADRHDLTLAADTRAEFDVLIDFSLPDGLMHWLPRCVESGAALVSGTTGLSEAEQAALRAAGRRIPALWAANFSVGINLLMDLASLVAQELGADFDVEIVETHHNRKVDAPSGTALSLARAIAETTGGDFDAEVVYGRRGQAGPRPKHQIGIHAVRLGDELGRHEIHFGGPGETLVLRHTVHSRDPFARGALLAAKWIAGQQPGFYTMREVVAPARSSSSLDG